MQLVQRILTGSSALWVAAIIAAPDQETDPGRFAQLRQADPPNIVLIVASQLSSADLGCYGGAATPNIDRLAAEGMMFTRCYGGSPQMQPAHAVLLSGLHTGHLPVENPTPPRAGAQTLAAFLQGRGYRTAGVGCWALGEPVPTRRGFEDWVGLLDPARFGDDSLAAFWRNDRELPATGRFQGTSLADLCGYVRSNYVRVTKYLPFFLYHAVGLPGAADQNSRASSRAARLKRLDREVGALLDQIKSLDLDHATAVFFTSDLPPQPSLPSDGLPFLTETNLAVPLLVRWPNRVQAGQTTDLLAASWDIFATAAQMSRTNEPLPAVDGISLLPTLLGQEQTNRHGALFWQVRNANQLRQAVRIDNWHATQTLEIVPSDPDPANPVAPPEGVWERIREALAKP